MHEQLPRVLSVNVGSVRTIEWRGRAITTGIWKHPVSGRIAVRGVNIIGDDQADRFVHGGPDKAVYAYAREDYDFWRDEENIETSPGLFGENLTTEGLDLTNAVVGARWSVGSTVLEITQPRLPCHKLGIRLNDSHFPKRFMVASRMGAYLRIVEEGEVGAHDLVHVKRTPSHGVTLSDMVEALRNPAKAAALRAVPRLPVFWRQVADEA
jgi:MOSC domain-containing protein YiiM